jgi:hypothetical protein
VSYQLLGRGKGRGGGEARRGRALGWVGARRGRGRWSREEAKGATRCGAARGGEDGGIGLGEFGEEVGMGLPNPRGAAWRGRGVGLEYYWTRPRGSVAGDTCAFGDGVSPCPVSSFCVFFNIRKT